MSGVTTFCGSASLNEFEDELEEEMDEAEEEGADEYYEEEN